MRHPLIISYLSSVTEELISFDRNLVRHSIHCFKNNPKQIASNTQNLAVWMYFICLFFIMLTWIVYTKMDNSFLLYIFMAAIFTFDIKCNWVTFHDTNNNNRAHCLVMGGQIKILLTTPTLSNILKCPLTINF